MYTPRYKLPYEFGAQIVRSADNKSGVQICTNSPYQYFRFGSTFRMNSAPIFSTFYTINSPTTLLHVYYTP